MNTTDTTYALINANDSRTVHLAALVVPGVANGRTLCGINRADTASWTVRGTGTSTTCLRCDAARP